MKAGRLFHLVTIEEPVKVLRASGDPSTTWEEFAQVYAHVESIDGQERWNSESVQPLVTHRVTIRFIDGITPDMRVIHRGRYLHISEPPINTNERDCELVLMCIEKR